MAAARAAVAWAAVAAWAVVTQVAAPVEAGKVAKVPAAAAD